jgi:hypothetical protein
MSNPLFRSKTFSYFYLMPKYRFRKMYFICDDKKIISPNVLMTHAYQFKKTADVVCQERQRPTPMEWEDKGKPVPKVTVEGFYLVPEAVYDEVLKKWVEKD